MNATTAANKIKRLTRYGHDEEANQVYIDYVSLGKTAAAQLNRAGRLRGEGVIACGLTNASITLRFIVFENKTVTCINPDQFRLFCKMLEEGTLAVDTFRKAIGLEA